MPGKLIIVTAPSGAGKTTIVRHLLATEPNLAFSVSATTRLRRDYEVDGKDYYYMSLEDFRLQVEADAFVEWEEVYPGKCYGTLRSEVERLWDAGLDIIFDVDVKGALNLKNQFPERTLSIFVKPPSVDALAERLLNRGTETPETLATRLERVRYELTFADRFDAVIVNDVLETALREASELVHNFLTAD
ncbi:MAG TPA: guanylate kinase [Chitinophagales bacterium]|nr:guanylate kinase [Chitinophagales bacterium]